jgi:hypothetical protein
MKNYTISDDLVAFNEGINSERRHTRKLRANIKKRSEEYERKLREDRLLLDAISFVGQWFLVEVLYNSDKEVWMFGFICFIWTLAKLLINAWPIMFSEHDSNSEK